MLPISNVNKNLARGPKNSEEFIEMCEDIHYDVVKLYDLGNQHSADITYNMDLMMIENYFMQNRISQLEQRVEALQNDVNNLDSSATYRTMRNVVRSKNNVITVNENMVQVDELHGLATLPYTVISKAAVIDASGNLYVPPSLSMTVNESTNGNTWVQINDQNIMKTFDCNNSSCWMHTSGYSLTSGVNSVYVRLYIKLPLQSINNAYVNAISIKPFPENSMEIVDIQYVTPTNLTPQTIQNFPVGGVKDAGKTLFTFPPVEVTDILVTLKQPYNLVSDNMKYFYYGMQEIGIYFNDYKSNYAYLVSEFSLDDKNFAVINTPTVVLAPGTPTAVTSLITHELFFPTGTDDTLKPGDIIPGNHTVQFGETIPQDHKKAYVLTKIEKTDEITPAVKAVEISYLTR